METPLKACPFCGDAPIPMPNDDLILCNRCGCGFQKYDSPEFTATPDPRTAWNTRAEPAPMTPEERAFFEAALAYFACLDRTFPVVAGSDYRPRRELSVNEGIALDVFQQKAMVAFVVLIARRKRDGAES